MITTLSAKQVRKYADVHIPVRVYYLEVCMVAVRLHEQKFHEKEIDLTVGPFSVPKQGGKLFCELGIETGLIYSRVLMNFLGIYLTRNGRLKSRAPRGDFQRTEVWIEKFPKGRLLSITELLSIRPHGQSKQKMYWHIVRSLQASNTESAHLTNTFFGTLRPGQLRPHCLYYTCWLARKHIFRHFYRDTIKRDVPHVLHAFDQTSYNVPEASP